MKKDIMLPELPELPESWEIDEERDVVQAVKIKYKNDREYLEVNYPIKKKEPERPRADKHEMFYFINESLEWVYRKDSYNECCDTLFKSGNYFLTKEEAEQARDRFLGKPNERAMERVKEALNSYELEDHIFDIFKELEQILRGQG